MKTRFASPTKAITGFLAVSARVIFDRAMRIAKRIRTGTISVNGGMCITGDIPFGGYKDSGIGREWGVEGIEEFLETKMIAYPVAPAAA